MTTPISSLINQLLKQILPHAAKDPRIAGLLLVAKGQSVCAQALLSHPTLRMQRGELAGFRVGQDKLADMDLIKSGRLEIGNSSEGEIPRVKVGGHYKLENTLTVEERIEALSAPQALPNAPKEGQQALPVSAAERCVLRDYIATDGYSQAMNEFLRGDFKGSPQSHSDLRERSLILVSFLNALPVQSAEAQHNLNPASPMFQAMLQSEKTGKPFVPDYFLSMSKRSDCSTPLIPSVFGAVSCIVQSELAKDISVSNALLPNERELIAAPISSYKVSKGSGFGDESSTKPWFVLTEQTKPAE